VRASQVGAVAAARRARRSHAERRALAVDLLRDPVFDALLTSRGPFRELPDTMTELARARPGGLCHVVEYPGDVVEHPGDLVDYPGQVMEYPSQVMEHPGRPGEER